METDQATIEATGSRLQELRVKRDLSQARLAEILQISARAYQNYENGHRDLPTEVVRALHQLLGIDPTWLLTGEGHEQASDTPDLLQELIIQVEGSLEALDRRLPAGKKARLIRTLCSHHEGRRSIDHAHVEELLQLVL